MPLLEAAIAGLPVVATDWSAHTEFLRGPSFLKVAYDLQEIPPSRVDGNIFVKHAMWAQPRGGNFSRKLKQAIIDNSSIKEHAQTLSHRLKSSHSMEALCRNFLDIVRDNFDELL